MSPSKKTDKKIIPVFYILDFDRCLGQTEKFQELLEEVIMSEQQIVSLEMIRYAHEQMRKTGGSFDTAAYVRQVFKDQGLDVNRIWGRIEERFIQAAQKKDMFEPYAEGLLDKLSSQQCHYGILTYGGYEWQTAKLKAAGLISIPHIITSYKEKGRTIASWQQVDKLFCIPDELSPDTRVFARQVVLIDDKPVSFVGTPPEVKGICVAPKTSEEQAALPPNVIVVKDMGEAERVLSRY